MYVFEICAEGIVVTFPWWLENVKSRSKIAFFFQMSAILKFDFQKRELRFSEVDYLNYTKKTQFWCGNYIFPKTRGNKNMSWTHSTPLKNCKLSFILWDLRWLLSLIVERSLSNILLFEIELILTEEKHQRSHSCLFDSGNLRLQ